MGVGVGVGVESDSAKSEICRRFLLPNPTDGQDPWGSAPGMDETLG